MASIPTREKQPDEKRTLTFDFGDKLVPSTTLVAPAIMQAEAELEVTSGTVASPTVTCQVFGGEMGGKYKVTCLVPASNGDILELDCFVKIKEVN